MGIIYLQKQFYTKCRLCDFFKYLHLCRPMTFNVVEFALIKNKNKIYTGAEIIMHTITFQ